MMDIEQELKLASEATAEPWIAPKLGFDITTEPNIHGAAKVIVIGQISLDDLRHIKREIVDNDEPYYTISSPNDRKFIASARTNYPLCLEALKEIKERCEAVLRGVECEDLANVVAGIIERI